MGKEYKMWIAALKEDKSILESFGIKLGPYNPDMTSFDGCCVPDEALDKLDSLWGTFYWGPDDFGESK